MSAGRDFLLFIFFLIVLGIAWFLTGGPSRTLSHSGWFLNGQGLAIPSVNVTAPNYQPTGFNTPSTQPASGQTSGQTQPSAWDYFFNYKVGLGETPTPLTSPYAANVRLSQANANRSDPAQEYVIIETSRSLKTPLTISGWSFENTSAIRAYIGDDAEIPLLGQVNSQTPVTVGPGSKIIVVTGRSPNGTSFRLNECTGYFGQFQTFTPALPLECPRASDEILQHADVLAGNSACVEFMNSINTCKIITNSSQIPKGVDTTCQSFVYNNLSYAGCLSAHQRDPGFYRNEWRIYLNRDQELWKNQHDVIRLLDESGQLVAQVSY